MMRLAFKKQGFRKAIWILYVALFCIFLNGCLDVVRPAKTFTGTLPTLSQSGDGNHSTDYLIQGQSDPEIYGRPSVFEITSVIELDPMILQEGAKSDYLVDRILEYFEREDTIPNLDQESVPPNRTPGLISLEEESEQQIAIIDVQNLPFKSIVEGQLTQDQLQIINHSYGIFNKLIPEPWRSDISKLYIIEDSGTAAFVNFDPDNDQKLVLGLNLDEMIGPSHSALDHYALITLFLHEFAHIFSMDPDQALPDGPCVQPIGETFDCYAKDSYLNQFNELFWSNVDPFYRENIDKPNDTLLEFYEKNESNFLNDYAASNPYEDFAETFVAFVTEYAPEDQSDGISKKILFFYQYPELVALRHELLEILVEIVDQRLQHDSR